MSSRRFPFTTLYVLLLFVAVVASWTVGIRGVTTITNMLTGDGVRWMVRNLLPNFLTAPLAESMLILFTLSMVRHCGRLRGSRSLVVALVVFALLLALLLWGIFSGCLLSLTAGWPNSPLQQSIVPLLFVLISIPCLCYGLSNGTIASGTQVLHAFTAEVARCAPYFLTLFVASQLVAVLSHTDLLAACGVGDNAIRLMAFLIYWIPFVVEFLRKPL